MELIKTKLSECCQIKPPKSEAKKSLAEDELVSFVPMKNLGINSKRLLLDSTRMLSDVSGSYTYFADNDVLLAKITPCFENGKLGIASELKNGIGFGSSEFIVFRPEKELFPEYLYYFLLRPSFRDDGKQVMTGAVGHKRVPKDFIENTKIPLVSISEQKRIVAILDQAFSEIEKARANAEKNLENARELFESYLQQVFSQRGDGWRTEKLSKVAKVSMGQSPKGSSYNFDGKGVPLINGPVEFGPTAFSKTIKSKYTTEPSKMCKEGDLILCVRGSTTGRMNIAGFTACIGRGVASISSGKHQSWLNHYINFNREAIYKLGSGATFPNVSAAILANFEVVIPPSEIMLNIISEIEDLKSKTEKMAEIYIAKIEALDELKKSILQKAFSGELTKAK
jgi:type I restriction enzyme S subunit